MSSVKIFRVIPVLVLALALAGCGSGSDLRAGGPDPATLAPADTPLYIELVVRPQGDLLTAVKDASDRLLGKDFNLGGRVIELLDKRLKKRGQSYAQDIEPWLGQRVGLALPDIGSLITGNDPRFAVFMATTSKAAAESVLKRLMERAERRDGHKLESETYRGISFKTRRNSAGESSHGLVENFMVATDSPSTFREIVDARGNSLASNAEFKQTIAGLSGGRLITGYVSGSGVTTAIKLGLRQLPREQLLQNGISEKQIQDFFKSKIAASSVATDLYVGDKKIGLELSVPKAPKRSSDGSVAKLVGDLPANSSISVGFADVGRGLLGQIKQQGSYAQIERYFPNIGSVLGWMGDTALFFSGTDLSSLGGGVVITTDSTDEAEEKVDELTGLFVTAFNPTLGLQRSEKTISGATGYAFSGGKLPPGVTINAVVKDKRAVIAFGDSATKAALGEGDRLSESDIYESAAEGLGNEINPLFLADTDSLAQLVATFDQDDSENAQKAISYLKRMSYIAFGTDEDNGMLLRLVVGLS